MPVGKAFLNAYCRVEVSAPIVSPPSGNPIKLKGNTLVVAAGFEPELDFYSEVCRKLRAGCLLYVPCLQAACALSSGTVGAAWPGIDLIQQADVVIGGGGYNTVHECASVGVPLIAKCWPRRFDDQRARCIPVARVFPIESAHMAAAIAADGDVPPPLSSQPYRFPQASDIIKEFIANGQFAAASSTPSQGGASP